MLRRSLVVASQPCTWQLQVRSLSAGRLEVRALDGTTQSLERAILYIRELQPKQLMLESCMQRRSFAERAAAAATAARAATPTETGDPQQGSVAATTPLSHADAINLVHGGIRGRDLVELLKEAEHLGTQVYMVDRPYHETQNLVAKRLVLHPRELLAFARHSLLVLTSGGGHATSELPCPAGVQDVLGREREQLMAAEVRRRWVRGTDAVLLCTAERLSGLQHLLGEAANTPSKADTTAEDKRSATRIWPISLVLIYVLLPGYGSIFLAWRVSRWIAAGLASLSTAPSLPDPEQVTRSERSTALPVREGLKSPLPDDGNQ